MSNEIYIDKLLDDLVAGKISHQELGQELLAQGVANPEEEIALHCAAAAAIQRQGWIAQVQKVNGEFATDSRTIRMHQVLRPMRKTIQWMVRIAAVVILLAGVWIAFQYTTNSSERLYSEIYQPYNINTQRGNGDEVQTPHNMVEEYRNNNYGNVIKTFRNLPASSNREKFLAASAYHETGDYPNAVALLNEILEENKVQRNRLYNDEAEYLLGLSYLRLDNAAKALPLLERIHDDPYHTFHERVSRWTIIRLKWLI